MKPLATTWRSAIGRETLGVGDFDEGDKIELTIKSVTFDQVPDPQTGKMKTKAVLHFTETERGLVLNAINSQRISVIAGSIHVDRWHGTKITLGLEEGKLFAGKRGPTIRVLESATSQGARQQHRERVQKALADTAVGQLSALVDAEAGQAEPPDWTKMLTPDEVMDAIRTAETMADLEQAAEYAKDLMDPADKQKARAAWHARKGEITKRTEKSTETHGEEDAPHA